MWYDTKATELLGIDYPILQGPFGGGLSSVELVAAVSNAGGLGGYGAYTMTPQEIYDIDKKIKAATDKPYNLNLWVSDTDAPDGTVSDEQYELAERTFKPYFDEAGIPLPAKPAPFKSRFETQLQAILDIRPRVFSFMFGTLPEDILEQCRKLGIRTVGAATTLDEAIALEATGVDMIIASGFEAGGHRPSFLASSESSTTGTFVLLQLIKEKVKTPVIAAGGIASRIAGDLLGKEKDFLPFPLQSTFMSSLRKAALGQEKWDMVLFWGGQIAPILKHKKAGELMRSLIEETGSFYPPTNAAF